ncbi:hypothetical protein ACNFIA_27900 [Pseudomonas sp. NY15437]|uniref:hypothetical protein n=1 Tax=Pseudomonas TaxID=286 RepID=UPI0007EE675C|nr:MULTISPECIES: hypothetical protein [Pseudomonas]NMZ76655.1 hypothetical protein [Pseudomonas nitroreducens]OBY48953.1 hypothetical protein A9513_031285 [Pseudomonas sp. AU12215]
MKHHQAVFHMQGNDVGHLSATGLDWLSEVGRVHGTTHVHSHVFPQLGSMMSAWRGEDLVAYFIRVGESAGRVDLHCVQIAGDMAHGMDLQLHQSPDDALSSGLAWMLEISDTLPCLALDGMENEAGDLVRLCWDREGRLVGYFATLQDPLGWTYLTQRVIQQAIDVPAAAA